VPLFDGKSVPPKEDMMSKILWLAGTLLLSSAASSAQMDDHAAMNHDSMQAMAEPRPAGEPTEGGEAAYAALGEVVRILLNDPKTDWSAVDVDTLRSHLVDMDNVTLRAEVAKTRLPNGAVFHVTGQGPVTASIQRMTKSHFAQPDFGKPWTMTVQPTATGADVTVVSANQADGPEIYGLGFFGILTMGTHHQPHHLMMARGMMHH
jgi:hypothetical protein